MAIFELLFGNITKYFDFILLIYNIHIIILICFFFLILNLLLEYKS